MVIVFLVGMAEFLDGFATFGDFAIFVEFVLFAVEQIIPSK